MDRTCLAHGIEGRAVRTAQRDEVPVCAVAVHFDGLVELRIEAEADEHDPVPVNLQLRCSPNCFEFSAVSGCSPRLVASWSMTSSVGFSMSSQNGWPPDELRYQRREGIPDTPRRVINPAPHGSRLRDSVST